MAQSTRRYQYDFRGHNLIPTLAANLGTPFSKADTSAAGAPTMLGLSGGGLRLLLASTSEVENLCLYMGDILPFDIDELISVEIIAKSAVTFNATTSVAFGLASARADDPDAITAHASFRCIGNNNVLVETDDGTNDNDDIATGLTLSTSWKRFSINFAERITTIEAPSVSKGRKSNIGFYGGNANGSQRRVASGTRFDMSNYSSGLQLYAQIQKTADTNVDSLDILEMSVEVNLPNFS